MAKETIAFDLDDVVVPHTDQVIAFSNAEYGTNWTRVDFATPGDYWGYFERLWGVSDDEGARRFQRFFAQSHPYARHIDEQTLDDLRALKREHDLAIVTARGAAVQVATLKMITDEAPDIFRKICFTFQYDLPNTKATKAEVCKEIGANYLVDDNLDHCMSMVGIGRAALLYGDFGWSATENLHEDIVRVPNMAAVREYFNAG